MYKTTKLNKHWLNFYNNIKDSSWPAVETQEDVLLLSPNILKEIIFQHVQQPTIHSLYSYNADVLLKNSEFFNADENLNFDKKFLVNDIIVYYHQTLDGGGTKEGQRIRPVIKELYQDRVFNHCFEWCSGPGFVGFDLLAHGICENLYMGEIYIPAIRAVNTTIKHLDSKYRNRVQCAHIKAVADLPTEWKFDLIVSNPPHWNEKLEQMITKIYFRDRICQDSNWDSHREFFSNIKQHLTPNGIILLQEHAYASGPEMFRSMIENNGLRISNCYWEPVVDGDAPYIYYLEVKHA